MELKPLAPLAEPPRIVPLSIRLSALLGGGGQVGWLVAAVGMVFVWVFAANGDLSFWRFRGELGEATGRITAVTKTSFSEGGGKHRRGTPIYAHSYLYSTPDGHKYAGTSYRKGEGYGPGDQVTVEFLAGDPAVSRIRGLRTGPFSAWVFFVLIVPLIGVAIILARLSHGRRGIHLLAHGRLALAKLQSKVPTGRRVNKQMVYKLTFRFQSDDGATHTVVAPTHDPAKLEDESQERVLYDPNDPARAMLLDILPGFGGVDDGGRLNSSGGRAVGVLVLPIAAIVGHALFAGLRYGG